MRWSFLFRRCGRWGSKTSYRRHTSGSTADGCSRLLLSTVIREKLFEIVQQIWRSFKKSSDLSVNFSDRPLFTLIRLKNFQKILVDIRLISNTSLPSDL